MGTYKKNAGNTLTIVLICLVVITILSLSLVYSVSYTTTSRLNESRENFNMVLLENKGYVVLNDIVKAHLVENNFSDELSSIKDSYTLSDPYAIKILNVTSDSISFKLRYKESDKALLVESKFVLTPENNINEYQIIKWGITSWN